jgi:hypothetical protein
MSVFSAIIHGKSRAQSAAKRSLGVLAFLPHNFHIHFGAKVKNFFLRNLMG